MLCAHSLRKLRGVAKIIRIVAVAGGRQQREMFPAAFVCPGGETRNRRFGDDVERGPFAHMPRGAVEPIEQVRAAWTWQLALGSVHEAIEDERVVWSEELGHPY